MIGAIIGDLAGSIYEYDQIKKVEPVKVEEIINENSFFSDDTILTIAIADAILSGEDYGVKLKEYAKKYENYIPNHKPYFKTTFSPGFTKWANGDYVGVSSGNGAMMRISPVGYLFDDEEEVVKNAYLATIPSHNDERAINSAKTIALIIFYARQGLSKSEIIEKLNLKIKEPTIKTFNFTCDDTIDVCLYSFFHSDSFEESIRKVLSYGGDTDTNACIVGSMGEAMYGICDDLKKEAFYKLPTDFVKVLKAANDRVNSLNEKQKYCKGK